MPILYKNVRFVLFTKISSEFIDSASKKSVLTLTF